MEIRVFSSQGDSGGPVVCKRPNGSWVQVGIVHVGSGCTYKSNFDIFTDVSEFNAWINNVIRDNE